MPQTPLQAIVDANADATLSVYATTAQNVPQVSTNGTTVVNITNKTEYITEVFNLKATAAGSNTELQFNDGNGLAGDSGLTYNANTDTLSVGGNVITGNLKTDNLLYANGTPYSIGSSYGNGNVASYLPTHTGNIAAGNISVTANLTVSSGNISTQYIIANGSALHHLPGANVTGTVANATYSINAGTVTTNAQPNITSVGTLSSVTVTGNISSGNASLGNLVTANYHAGNGSLLTSLSGANVTGTVANATYSISAGSSTTASTITTNAQPNITSVGSLSGLTVSNASGVVNFTTTANVTLGAVGNLHITGGTSGQYLQTNGSGSLSWSAPTTPNLYQVTNQGNTTNVAVTFANAVSITDTTESTSFNSGALKVSGGLGTGGNLHANGHITSKSTIYAGRYSDLGSWETPSFLGRDVGATYMQGALVNLSDTGSADWIGYGDNYPVGTNSDHGWVDVGYTSSNFDPHISGVDTYSITKSNDGYVFAGAVAGSGFGGNLVLATDYTGANNDIVFGLGGFTSSKEFARMDGSNKTFTVGGEVIIKNHNEHGGTGFAGMMTFNNDTATAGKKFFRINSTGNLQIVNDAYTTTIFDLADNGDMIVTGNLMPAGNVAKDIGSSTHRFKDLWLSGTTIHLGGTSISVDPTSGNISMGNITIDGAGTISGDSISGNLTSLGVTGTTNLGAVGNVTITGGTAGQVLTTDGVGNLSWGSAPPAATASTVTDHDQPNITSVGTITGLNATGNITFNNSSVFEAQGETYLGAVSNVYINGGTAGQVLTTDGVGNLSWTTVSGGGGGSYGDSDVSTLLGSFGSNNIVTTGYVQAKNIRANASHANLVFGDATSSSGPGMSSTDTLSIVTNRGTSDKTWFFGTDGNLSVPGSIIPSANVTYDLGAPTARFKDLYLSGTTIDLGGVELSSNSTSNTVSIGNTSIGNGNITLGNVSIIANTSSNSVTVGNTTIGDNGNLILGNVAVVANTTSNSIVVGNTTIGGNGNIILGNLVIDGDAANGSITVGNTVIYNDGNIDASHVNVGNVIITANNVSNSLVIGSTQIHSNGQMQMTSANIGTSIVANTVTAYLETSTVGPNSSKVGMRSIPISTKYGGETIEYWENGYLFKSEGGNLYIDPEGVSIPLPVGSQIKILATTGNCWVTPNAGVSLYKYGSYSAVPSALMVAHPYGFAELTKLAANTWYIRGDIF